MPRKADWEQESDTRASIMSTSSIPSIIVDTLLAIKRSTTAAVASVSIAIIDPSTVGTRFSLRLGTACKHSLDTSEKDPIVLMSFSETLSRHKFTSLEAYAMAVYVSHLLLFQASILAATAPEVAQRRLASYRGIGC